jgi:hypothetical protein
LDSTQPYSIRLKQTKHTYFFLGEDYEEVQPENVKVIEDFHQFWYQKKCLREANVPWAMKSSIERNGDVVDPLLLS